MLPVTRIIWKVNYEFVKMESLHNFVALVNLFKPTGYVMHQQVWHSTIIRCVHTVFMCFVFIWEQTATSAPYNINRLIFITEMKSVYCAVRTGSLN